MTGLVIGGVLYVAFFAYWIAAGIQLRRTSAFCRQTIDRIYKRGREYIDQGQYEVAPTLWDAWDCGAVYKYASWYPWRRPQDAIPADSILRKEELVR